MTPSNNLYDHPRYYEIAFSFRDIPGEVDVMEDCFRRYARIPVKRVLELGCGPAPHMPEWVRRGYAYIGLDINPTMLAYAGDKAAALGLPATLVRGDMRRFSLDSPVDFAYTLLGSLFVETTPELLDHLGCVARILRPGGLYLLESCIHFAWDEAFMEAQDHWVMEQDGITVSVSFEKADPTDYPAQVSRDVMVARVYDGERVLRLESLERTRLIFPQEFLLLLEKTGAFEFVGWWNCWNLEEPMERAQEVDRPITLTRRK